MILRPLPDLPADQVALLATQGPDGPVVVPVSALRRDGDTRLLFALKSDRASANRLREDDRASVSLSGVGFSLCARGRARLLAERLAGAEHMSAFRLEITHAWDARGPATEVEQGIRWSWATPESAARHRTVLDALARLAEGWPPGP